MNRRNARAVGVVAGAAVLAAVGVTVAGGSASAATLDCLARGQDQTIVDGSSACRAVADDGSAALAHVEGDGVGVADSRDGAVAAGIGLFGGVGAADTRGGALAAVAFGPGSLALGRTTSTPFAFVVSGPGGRAAVGDADVGAICSGGPTVVFNFATGQGCLSDGTTTWVTP